MNAPVSGLAPTLASYAPMPRGWAAGLRLAFLHIPKTAGTAFGAALAQHFSVAESHDALALAKAAGGASPLLAETAAAPGARLIGVGVHLDRDKLDAIEAALPPGERLFTVTLLRDPRARLISQFRHWRRNAGYDISDLDAEQQEALRATRDLPIGEFLALRLPVALWHMRNQQARMLAGFATSELLDEEATLAAARASLAAIDVVGTTDRVDEVLARIADARGWPTPDTVRPLNVARDTPPMLDDATEALIEEYTRLDAVLWRELQEGSTAAFAPRPRHGYFRQPAALLAALAGDGATRFDMRQPLLGQGWHVREGRDPVARWTGPETLSRIQLDVPPARRVTVAIQLISVLDWAIVEGARLTLDGIPPIAPPAIRHGLPHPLLEASFDLPNAAGTRREFAIEMPFTTSHAAVNPAIPDDRQKGIAIGAITLAPAAAEAPTRLDSLFWPGRSWSGAAPAALLDLAGITREAPVIAADRHLGFDLAVMAGVLGLVAPDHVWIAARRSSVLDRFASGEMPARPAAGATLAVLATLFEMPARGCAIATLAAGFDHATLVLACAEDHRLRALAANPLLAPHMHVLGCTNVILLADLAGLRRAGGAALVEALLFLIERIAATTPELLSRMDPGVAAAHLRRQIASQIALVEGAASPLAALLPAPGTAPDDPSPVALRARAQALPRGQAPLSLVDPALLGALDGALDAMVGVTPGTEAAWQVARAAHDRAFRLAGILAGWQGFGLGGNATAQLAATLRGGAATPPIAPKPLKPFREYIDFYKAEARVMALRSQARDFRISLDTLGGGLDHVVRLGQAAREVELALRLLARRFPGEEILWVDAGCSYGVLLNTVEPPRELFGRCRFLGFDFNAPAIEAARIAAANGGRAHCRFEIGDVAEARAITEGRRIHLVTAFEVLEHCPDPLAVLRDYRAMDPGMLVVGSPLREPQGILPAEQHLWTFEAEGYAALVGAAGFTPVGVNRREVGRFVGGHDWVTVTATTGEAAALAML
jgi:hypothetical protein